MILGIFGENVDVNNICCESQPLEVEIQQECSSGFPIQMYC